MFSDSFQKLQEIKKITIFAQKIVNTTTELKTLIKKCAIYSEKIQNTFYNYDADSFINTNKYLLKIISELFKHNVRKNELCPEIIDNYDNIVDTANDIFEYLKNIKIQELFFQKTISDAEATDNALLFSILMDVMPIINNAFFSFRIYIEICRTFVSKSKFAFGTTLIKLGIKHKREEYGNYINLLALSLRKDLSKYVFYYTAPFGISLNYELPKDSSETKININPEVIKIENELVCGIIDYFKIIDELVPENEISQRSNVAFENAPKDECIKTENDSEKTIIETETVNIPDTTVKDKNIYGKMLSSKKKADKAFNFAKERLAPMSEYLFCKKCSCSF